MDYKHINIKHKAMMALLIKKIKKIEEKDRDEEVKLMLQTYGQTVDFTDKSTIDGLVDYCKAH